MGGTIAIDLGPDLVHWARLIEGLRWAGFLLDRELRLVWVSPDVERFLGSPPEEEIGYGLHFVEALSGDAWRRVVTPESRARFWTDLGPFVVGDAAAKGALDSVSESFRSRLLALEPRPFTEPVATSFDYLEPGSDDTLPPSRVNVLCMPLRDETGDTIGFLGLSYMSVRPGLVSLLARGDEAMYERMAKLVEPRSHQGAILFCDLHGSTELARTLPTAEYFRLVRRLWTEIDALVARNHGIVGKHAGDGASAFFLVGDLGSPTRAASAAIGTARAIHDRSDETFGVTLDGSCLMRVGLHWASSIYIGQLVPGGRLEITALGDAVNECALIQESADPRRTLASKALIEQLSPEDAARFAVDPEDVRYRLIAEMAGAAEKARRAAGGIPVTTIG